MPGANELSTFEWHNAQVIPTALRPLVGSLASLKIPSTPTTAPSCSSVNVVAGSVVLAEVAQAHDRDYVPLSEALG